MFPVEEDLDIEKVWFDDTQDAMEVISNCIEKDQTMGIDKNLPSRFLLRLMELDSGKEFKNASPLIDKIRIYKDSEEISLMKEASRAN